jgi:HTH-type transcriptional regulator / antitoxin HigA
LDAWYRIAKSATWRSIEDVRATYPSADPVERYTVFNIKGNKYRLIVKIEYRFQQVFIKHFLSHARVYEGGLEEMSALAAIDPKEYRKLLSKALPTVIKTEEQNEEYIRELEDLTSHERLSPEEQELAALLTVLIEDFEQRNYRLKASDPVDVLMHLMEANDLKQKDLVEILGTKSIVSEILGRKRRLTVDQIKRLSKRFNVSPQLFM